MGSISQPEVERHFPGLWSDVKFMLEIHLARLGVFDADAEEIIADLLGRCAGIDPTMPADSSSSVHMDFAAQMISASTAGQRLFAAKHGRMPGTLIEDWPTTPLRTDHPFLIAFSKVVSQIEAEANAADGTAQN